MPRDPSVTGGLGFVFLWPGGAGDTRRKHRLGEAGNQRTSFVSARGGGRPWPPPPATKKSPPHDSKRIARTPWPGHSLPFTRAFIRSRHPPVNERLPCFPGSLFKRKKVGKCFEVSAGHGDGAALREVKAVVFPWDRAGPQAFRLLLRNPSCFHR